MHGLRGDNGDLEYGVGALLSPDRRSGEAAGELLESWHLCWRPAWPFAACPSPGVQYDVHFS